MEDDKLENDDIADKSSDEDEEGRSLSIFVKKSKGKKEIWA